MYGITIAEDQHVADVERLYDDKIVAQWYGGANSDQYVE